jgi:hypothetical protein
MEWAYIQIASLVLIVSFAIYMGVADARLRREG